MRWRSKNITFGSITLNCIALECIDLLTRLDTRAELANMNISPHRYVLLTKWWISLWDLSDCVLWRRSAKYYNCLTSLQINWRKFKDNKQELYEGTGREGGRLVGKPGDTLCTGGECWMVFNWKILQFVVSNFTFVSQELLLVLECTFQNK